MTRIGGLAAVQLCVASVCLGAVPMFTPARPVDNDIVLENRVPVVMRDGTVLFADIYRPAGAGRFPVIVARTPYGVDRFAEGSNPHAYEAPVFFARRGYVFVYQDVRGRYESEGRWEPFHNDVEDGYDTIEWAARQPWSNGKVGMHGVSYQGTVQWRAAIAAPPHLVTIVPSVASTSAFHDWVTSNGAWRLAFNLEWGAIRMESRTIQNPGLYFAADAPPSLDIATIHRHLPLDDMPRAAGRSPGFFSRWLAHPDYDDYWKSFDVEERFERVQVPVLSVGGWFDLFSQGTIRGYRGVRSRGATPAAKQGTRLVMGPWGHWPSQRVGEVDFGDTAFVDYDTLALEWYDYWLAGRDNAVGGRAPARLFVMGANEWRDEDGFPPSRARNCKLYLHSEGNANTALGNGRLSVAPPGGSSDPDRYVYDPANPAPAVGGAADARLLEARQDVLVYTSASLDTDLEVVGPLEVVLHASSDAPDTDFLVRLVDVHPDGQALAVAGGILRARYRNSTSKAEWLEPGVVYPLKIDIGGTAIRFHKGHRLRVHVTSSAFPAFDRNLNTALPFGRSSQMRRALQSVHHSSDHPSHIVLPVTDEGSRSQSPLSSLCALSRTHSPLE